MAASLLPRVKSTLALPAQRKSLHALDGAYASLRHGRSVDFEDLREYQHGDEVRDIDWRATARHSTLLVRRTRATRLHTVLFAVDAGRTMTALAPDDRTKKDLALLATGALGVLALRHGDEVSFVFGDADGTGRLAPARSEGALEGALRTLDQRISASSAANAREALLDRIARTVERRTILVVVTDEAPVTDRVARLLRRLRLQHDVLWITLADADPVLPAEVGFGRGAARGRRDRADVDTGWAVPGFVQGDPEVYAELRARRTATEARLADLLSELGIGHTVLTAADTVVPDLLRLLHRRSRARSR